jgi:hypothetical protein
LLSRRGLFCFFPIIYHRYPPIGAGHRFSLAGSVDLGGPWSGPSGETQEVFRGYTYKENYETGEWQMRVETADGRELRRIYWMRDGGWYRSDPVANSSAVREIFQTWASDLQRELDQFHALPALPAVDTGTPPK